FTGREFDSESGLLYYRARYYDPKIGRFISEDPITFDGGINFYAYVGNNPINLTDPFGEQDPGSPFRPPARVSGGVPQVTIDEPTARTDETQVSGILLRETETGCFYLRGQLGWPKSTVGLTYLPKSVIKQKCGKTCPSCPKPGFAMQLFQVTKNQ